MTSGAGPHGSPVQAVRAGPGAFILAAESVITGTEFRVGGQTFRVVAQPVTIATQEYLARCEIVAGLGTGSQLNVRLRVGKRVDG